MNKRASMTAVALAGALVVAAADPAAAAPCAGSPDPAFGTGGVVVTGIGGPGGNDSVSGIAALPAGATLAVGYTRLADGTQDFALVKYLRDGSPDPAFGTGGTVVTDVSGTGADDVAMAVAVQPDGKLVVTGAVRNGWEQQFALARYLPDGSLDPAFGTGGTVITAAIAAGFGGATAVALQRDGTIVAVGTHFTVAGGNQFAAARYLPDGSLDPAFGTGGTVVTPVSVATPGGNPSVSYDRPSTVAIQRDGAIVVGGSAGRDYGRHLVGYEFALLRYTPAGVLDPAFGTGGTVVTDVDAGVSTLREIALRPDGRIVAVGTGGGSFTGGETDVAVAQYTAGGTLDTAFGTGGIVLTDVTGEFGRDRAAGLALRPDGRLLVAGTAHRSSGPTAPGDTVFLLARYDRKGVLDPAFGAAGVTLADVDPAYSDENANAMAVHRSGRVIIGGSTYAAGPAADFLLAAFHS